MFLKILRSSSLAFSFRVLVDQFVGLMAFAVIARFFNRYEFGSYVIALSVFEIARTFCTAGLSDYIVRARRANLHFLLLAIIIVDVIVIFLIYLFAQYYTRFLKQDQEFEAISAYFSFLIVPASLGAIYSGVLSRLKRVGRLSLILSLSNIVSVLLMVTLLYCGFKTSALVVQKAVYELPLGVLSCVCLVNARRRIFDKTQFIDLMVYFLSVSASSVMNILLFRSLEIIFGAMYSASIAGQLRIATRFIVLLMNTISWPISTMSLIIFSRNRLMQEAILNRSITVLLLLILPSSVGLAYISTDLISILFTDAWTDASTYVSILAIGVPFSAVSAIIFQYYNSRNRPYIQLISNLVILLVGFSPYLLFGRIFVASTESSCIAIVVGQASIALLLGGYLIACRVRFDLKIWLKLVIATIAMRAALDTIGRFESPVATVTVAALLGAGVYFGVIFLTLGSGIWQYIRQSN